MIRIDDRMDTVVSSDGTNNQARVVDFRETPINDKTAGETFVVEFVVELEKRGNRAIIVAVG